MPWTLMPWQVVCNDMSYIDSLFIFFGCLRKCGGAQLYCETCLEISNDPSSDVQAMIANESAYKLINST